MSRQGKKNDDEEEIVWSEPPCRLLVRSKKQVELFSVPERNFGVPDEMATNIKNSKRVLVTGASSMVRMTSDNAFILMNGVGVVKCNLAVGGGAVADAPSGPFLQSTASVQMMDVSPKGTYILTWERYYADKCPNNLKLWRCDDGTLVAAFAQKALKREAWPYLQFTHDESIAFLLCTNEVRVYEASAFQKKNSSSSFDPSSVRFTEKLRIQGITTLSVPAKANDDNLMYLFTAFCPGNKDKPARASLHEYPKSMDGPTTNNSSNHYPTKLSKSLFQAEEMKTHWNPGGDAALITLQTSVDATGESYYGSSQLFLLSQLGKDVEAVPLEQKSQANGPVLAVEWMPNPIKPACFAVVAGKMPAMASLHNGLTGEPIFLFGQAHRNTVSFAPHGRFLLLGGFGNLAGGMGFWDRNKQKVSKMYPSILKGWVFRRKKEKICLIVKSNCCIFVSSFLHSSSRTFQKI